MGKNIGFIKYVFKSPFKNTFRMYIYGSGLMSLSQLILSLSRSNTFSQALDYMINYYILKFTPFPLDEFITAEGFIDVFINISIAILFGSLVAGLKWRKNI